MEVVKSDFKVKLRSKIKEEQMIYLNQNGIKNLQETALILRKDSKLKELVGDDKKNEIKNLF
jgi:hypothetical protein